MERVYEIRPKPTAPQAYRVEVPQRPLKSHLDRIKNTSKIATRVLSAAAVVALTVQMETSHANAEAQAIAIKDTPNPEFILAEDKWDLGRRVVNEYTGTDGIDRIVFERNSLEKAPDQPVIVTRTSEIMSNMGLDDKLHDGSLGVTLPRPSKAIIPITIPQDAKDFADQHQEQLGKPTSPGERFTDDKGDFVYEAYRTETGGFKKNRDGTFDIMLVGNAAINAGIVPPGAILESPTDDSDLKAANTEPEVQVDESQLAPTLAPAPAPYTPLARWSGVASYYTTNGCLGCNASRFMANGEKFNENALTLAFMETPLNCVVHVTNQANGLGVDARVTDRGGFKPYGRIADLSLGTRNAIRGGDLTRVNIDLVHC